jgi:hypothetical protein
MGAALEVVVTVETATDVWTDITADVMASEGIRINYGISGDKPLDTVAGTGDAQFTVDGYEYSFQHADVLAGWAFGAGIRILLYRTLDTAQAVASITRSSATATVTTSSSHGYSSEDWITIAGATQTDYNGSFRITKTAATTFTYDLGTLTPATPASGTITARIGYLKHNGKLRSADPAPGAYRTRRVTVTSYDGMRDLAETQLRDVAVQINQSESQLLTTVLAAVPATAQPKYQSIDAGVDTYPYAFNELGSGTSVLRVVKNVCVSSYGTCFMRGDGTLEFQSRNTRATGAAAFHFDETMHGLTTNASIDELVNHVQTTISPRSIDSAATTKVYQATGTPFSVEAGETITMVVDYRDPSNPDTLIGATDVINATATTDYLGNSLVDGSGSNLTSSLAIVTTQYASTATLAITNNHATATIYLVDASGDAFLQLRGKGVYEHSPQTFTAKSSQPYGDKTLNISLTYQDNLTTAQSYALVVEEKYNQAAHAQLESISFHGNDSADLLLHALSLEPGDMIEVTETNVGASQILMVIQSVGLAITSGPWVTVTLGLAPSSAFAMWLLGTVGRSEIGETTTLGF